MDRSVTVRFYEIQTVGEGGLSFEATLRRVREMPLARRQSGAGDEVVLRLEHATRHDGIITGDFTRVQTENLPSHPDDEAAHPLPVDRLGYHSAFCFDPVTQILALQCDLKTAIGRVCAYLARFAEGSSFSYLPVLRQDALERFQEETPTKLRIKVARVNQFRNLGLVATDFEQSLEQMGE